MIPNLRQIDRSSWRECERENYGRVRPEQGRVSTCLFACDPLSIQCLKLDWETRLAGNQV